MKTTLYSILGSTLLISAAAVKVCPADQATIDAFACSGDAPILPTNCITTERNTCGRLTNNCIYTNGCAGKNQYLFVESDDASQQWVTALYTNGDQLEIATYPAPYDASNSPPNTVTNSFLVPGSDSNPYWGLCVVESGTGDGQLIAYEFADDTCSGSPTDEVILSDFADGTVCHSGPYEFCVDHTGDDVFQDEKGTYAWVLSQQLPQGGAPIGACDVTLANCGTLSPVCFYDQFGDGPLSSADVTAIFNKIRQGENTVGSPGEYGSLHNFFCTLQSCPQYTAAEVTSFLAAFEKEDNFVNDDCVLSNAELDGLFGSIIPPPAFPHS